MTRFGPGAYRAWTAVVALSKAVLVAFFVLICGLLVLLFATAVRRPPSESRLIENFYAHRDAYERLREMLLADKKLRSVAGWGVETTESLVAVRPPAGSFPVDRYNQYLGLLKEAGALAAFRDEGAAPESVGVLVYASGFAGDTRHIDVTWMDHPPANQVASLDNFYRTRKPRKPAYRHIDGNWYLWADW